MRVKVTITLTPETKNEAANDFVTKFETFRGDLEASIAAHGLLNVPPANVDTRFVLNLPRFD